MPTRELAGQGTVLTPESPPLTSLFLDLFLLLTAKDHVVLKSL